MGVVAPQGRVGPPGRRAVHCAAMEYRNLGRSGVQVSSVSLGSWLTFGSRIEVAETARLIQQAYDLGAAGDRPKIVVTHHAAFCNTGQQSGNTDAKAMNPHMVLQDTVAFREVCERHGVKLVLQGHSHAPEEYVSAEEMAKGAQTFREVLRDIAERGAIA